MNKTETMIEQEILTALATWSLSKNSFFWKNVSGGFYDGIKFRKQASPFAINGTSDILGIVSGVFVALEVKTDNGRASDAQKAFIEKIRRCGGVSAVVRSVDQALRVAEEAFEISLVLRDARATSKLQNE